MTKIITPQNTELSESWKPRVFIGSSSNGKKIAEIAKELLESDKKIEVEVWDKIFKAGDTYIERLARALDEFDFAILIVNAEDKLKRRGNDEEQSTMRDNVLFELGLFMGHLGRNRAIMLYDEKQKADLPSDLSGVHAVTYPTPEKNKLKDALQKPCDKLKEYILEPNEPPIIAYPVWKKYDREIYEALQKAPNNATIRIIQTWFPDLEEFIVILESLLINYNKRFKLKILLLAYHENVNEENEKKHPKDILEARITIRKETYEKAVQNIENAKSQFENLKENVEAEWKKTGEPDFLDIEIRKYEFLPFGPYYQIGEKVLFAGFYLNHCSSLNAPMVKIHNKSRTAWLRFTKHFDSGWENSEDKIFYESHKPEKHQQNKFFYNFKKVLLNIFTKPQGNF